jgi:DNA-binding transcriptional MerR regulator
MKSIAKFKEKEFIGVAQLADASKEVLEAVEIPQKSGAVAPYPNERTIRYYLAEGILPPAAYNEGAASVFTYRHLITLVAIKRLQSQGLPIKIIRRVVGGRTTAELEKLLDEPVRVSTDIEEANRAQKSGEEVMIIHDRDEIREILESPLAAAGEDQKEPEYWERFSIIPGIELHVSQNSGLDKKNRRKLARAIEEVLREF